MSNDIRDILINKELIAIDQDPLGKQGFKIVDDGNFEIWQKQLSDGAIAICLLNLEIKDKDYTISWSNMNIKDFSGSYKIKNLWKNKISGNTGKAVYATVPARDVLIFKLTKSIE